MHHSDKSVWLVYFTISNLNRKTCCQQTSPRIILIGFVPIIEEKDNYIKSKAYHKAIRLILKHIYYFYYIEPFINN